MSESSIQLYCLKKLRSQYPEGEWEKATVTNIRGSQDVKGSLFNISIKIEFKKDDILEPSEIQKYRIYQTNKNGGFSFYCGSWKKCKELLNIFLQEKGGRLLK